MALVRVSWTETRSYECDMDVPNFTLTEGEPSQLRDVIMTLGEKELELAKHDGVDIDITGHQVLEEAP